MNHSIGIHVKQKGHIHDQIDIKWWYLTSVKNAEAQSEATNVETDGESKRFESICTVWSLHKRTTTCSALPVIAVTILFSPCGKS